MDWMVGEHLSEYCNKNDNSRKVNDKLGQTLWDFYMFQMHKLKKVQADPHPGNFLVSEKHQLVAIDFGCIKTIPEDFYVPYFELSKPQNIADDLKFESLKKPFENLNNSISNS